MNKKIFKQLCMNYNKSADKELYELWEYNLRVYDEEEMQKAINIIISTDKYFPNLNRLLEVVKDVVSKETITDKYKIEHLNKIKPEWYGKDIESEEIGEDIEFKKFIEDFRGSDE